MSNEYYLQLGIFHEDKAKMADCSVRDPFLLKELFTDGCEVANENNIMPDGWLSYRRTFARMAPVNEVILRCKLAHTAGWDYQMVFYETLDHFEDLYRLGHTNEDWCFNGIWTTRDIVDHGSYKLKKRKHPLPGALITESKPQDKKDLEEIFN